MKLLTVGVLQGIESPHGLRGHFGEVDPDGFVDGQLGKYQGWEIWDAC